MGEQCNHAAHNWNVVYQCRNCNEIVPEEIAEGYIAYLEAREISSRAIMEKFVGKVDTGMARSKETYREMKEWLDG